MITRLFRSKQKRLDGTEPRERLAAIHALTEAEVASEQSALAALAGEDPDLSVRRAAIGLLEQPTQLAGLLEDPGVGADAARRIAELISADTPAEIAAHPSVLKARLAIHPDPALLDQIALQGDPALLVAAVLASPREARAALLDRFTSATLLGELERGTRDKDKALNRHARSRLETLKQLRQAAGSQAERAEELLESLAKANADATASPAKRSALIAELNSTLAALNASAEALGEFDETIDTLPALTAQRSALLAAVPQPAAASSEAPAAASNQPAAASNQPAAANNQPATADGPDPFEALTSALEKLGTELRSSGDLVKLDPERQAVTRAWSAAADARPPEPAQHAVFERTSHDFQVLREARTRLAELDPAPLRETLEQIPQVEQPKGKQADQQRLQKALGRQVRQASAALQKLDWPDWAPLPAGVTELNSELDLGRRQLAVWEALSAKRLEEALGHLESLTGQITAGELKAAQRSVDEIRRLLEPLPGSATGELNRRLAREVARLAELKDWQTFATGPKREALCEKMAELAAAPLPPADQAHRIKRLRAEWNELGPITRAADHRLLKRFNELAEDAFKPCREHFARQAEVRAENLAAREQICQQLESYLASTDWSQADYKAAEQIIRTAREEWRRFHPVDRAAGKPLERRFEQLQDALHDHIKAEWERNLAAKRAIVAEAQALAADEAEVRSRIETAKTLQQRWQQVGVTPRRPDQQLWQDFRAACDAIFHARDQAQRSADEALQSSQQATREIVDALAAAVTALTSGTEPDQSALRDFRNRFAAQPELPERLQRPLTQEFNDLVKTYRLAIEDQRQAERRAELAALADQDRTVAALEIAHRRGEQVDFEAPTPLFAGRWTRVDNDVPTDEIRRLAIEAEIAAGLESPTVERDARLAIQVDLMNSGRGREALDADAMPLAERWCQLGPKDDDCEPLRTRFFEAITVLDRR